MPKIKNWKLIAEFTERIIYKNKVSGRYACAFYNHSVNSWIAFLALSPTYRPRKELEPSKRRIIAYKKGKPDKKNKDSIKRELVSWMIKHPEG